MLHQALENNKSLVYILEINYILWFLSYAVAKNSYQGAND